MALSLFALFGCATALEQRADSELAATDRAELPVGTGSPLQPESRAAKQGVFDGTLEGYLAYALENSPALRATYEEWRAAVHRIPEKRRLPEPTISYAYFVRNVETRVGPQRHRIGVTQAFPWPTRLTAGADSASLAARSTQRRFDAAALMLARRVSTAYWKLWLAERQAEVQRDQRAILEQLSGSARGRVEAGEAGFADVAQIDLNVSRTADAVSEIEEKKKRASAELIAAVGAPPGTPTPVVGETPRLVLPAEDEAALKAAAKSHPRIGAIALMADSRKEGARGEAAEQFPAFALGVDYIETGPARTAGVPDSGKDPIIVMLSVRVPLWGGVYSSSEDAALAESAAFRARAAAARDEAVGELEAALSKVRDAARRVKLYRSTLVPQAESVYGAVVGSYQAGRATLANVLIAQRDLLELQLGLFRAHADHAAAWAELEEIVGRPVKAKEAGT